MTHRIHLIIMLSYYKCRGRLVDPRFKGFFRIYNVAYQVVDVVVVFLF